MYEKKLVICTNEEIIEGLAAISNELDTPYFVESYIEKITASLEDMYSEVDHNANFRKWNGGSYCQFGDNFSGMIWTSGKFSNEEIDAISAAHEAAVKSSCEGLECEPA